ncbi:MAG: VWA domain-containing protein [Clostridium sp.]|nr:VWA domain-containing protein [Clostridium sp.]
MTYKHYEQRPLRQLLDLQQLFLQRLEQAFAQNYGGMMDAGVITPEEGQEECRRYYDKYKSGLHSFYSYYTEQWEAFYTLQETTADVFRTRLSNLVQELENKYGAYGLNARYYLNELNKLVPDTPEWNKLRTFFLDRWCRVLSDREYNYQLTHLEQLCRDFILRLKASAGESFSEDRGIGVEVARMAWVSRHVDPKLKQRIAQLAMVMQRNPIARDLVRLLGRRTTVSSRKYRAAASRNEMNKVRRASQSDIQGVTVGNDLNHLMPFEYGMLGTPRLTPLFLKRYAERNLQMFDSRSLSDMHARKIDRRGNELSQPEERGPMVICVDTSGSMSGSYEEVAKAIVLSIILLTERERRLCRIILFSSDILTLEIRTMSEALHKLTDFLCTTFHGGTDFTPMIKTALDSLQQEDYRDADLLLLSDFETDDVSPTLRLCIEEHKQRGLEVYAVGFGHKMNTDCLDLADRFWHYQ